MEPADDVTPHSRLSTSTVVGKINAVLHAFDADDEALSLAVLTRRTGIPKGTLHRVAADLVEARLLERVGGGYRLGTHLFELGMRASLERRLAEVGGPFMQDLCARTQEVVHLGIIDRLDVLYVQKIGGHRQAPAPTRVGGRMPLFCTGIGKVLLAHEGETLFRAVVGAGLERHTPRTIVAPGLLRTELGRIMRRGLAYEREESVVGIACAAAPVRRGGRVVAAISLAGPVTRFRPERHAVALRAAADGVSRSLDGSRTSLL